MKDKRIWEANLDPKDCKNLVKGNVLDVAQDILTAWSKFHYTPVFDETDKMLETPLWGNSLIRRKKQPIFEDFLCRAEFSKVWQLVNFEQKRLMTYQEITGEYECNFDTLTYLGLIAAIPRLWKQIIKTLDMNQPLDYTPAVILLSELPKKSSRIYWDLIKHNFPVAQVNRRLWEYDLKMTIDEDDWLLLYEKLSKTVKCTKLLSFQFRLLHRSIITNVRRHKWDPRVDPRCSFCHTQQETVEHLLFSCSSIQPIWHSISKIIKYYFNIDINFTCNRVILNNYSGPKANLINQFILVTKQYIYVSKCLQKDPTFMGVMSKLSTWFHIEKLIIHQNYSQKKFKDFCKKWGSLF